MTWGEFKKRVNEKIKDEEEIIAINALLDFEFEILLCEKVDCSWEIWTTPI